MSILSTISDVLQSEFHTELRDNLDERIAVIELEEMIHEHALAFKPERSSGDEFSSSERIAGRKTTWINSFLDGLCKYLFFSKLKVKADLNEADLLSSSNLVCFDRDEEFFATGGVNKKNKVFEYDSILNGNCDVQYPVVEMAIRSKLSGVCWNRCIKGQIASSNFEGIAQVRKVNLFFELIEKVPYGWPPAF
ncbi:hypothetical protein L6452_28601 [Arctium lappa]|uniref:Uncharacterized protein n=1 Tax=Arctium lappa TaxID=4217 RepID=A0ACB8ZZ54_ARCLA|nr:hypothetical protein L6452_28601 [Arctium lappa]